MVTKSLRNSNKSENGVTLFILLEFWCLFFAPIILLSCVLEEEGGGWGDLWLRLKLDWMMLTSEVYSEIWDGDRVCHSIDSHCRDVNNPYFMESSSLMERMQRELP